MTKFDHIYQLKLPSETVKKIIVQYLRVENHDLAELIATCDAFSVFHYPGADKVTIDVTFRYETLDTASR